VYDCYSYLFSKFIERDKRYKGLDNHSNERKRSILIIISDFISPQAFDRKRNWSDYINNFLLISLGTNFDDSEVEKNINIYLKRSLDTEINPSVIKEYNISYILDKGGFLPFYTKRDDCDSVKINPEILASGGHEDSSVYENLCDHIINALLGPSLEKVSTQPRELNIKTLSPENISQGDRKLIWSDLNHMKEFKITEKTPIFAQVQSAHHFPLVKSTISSTDSVRVEMQTEIAVATNSQWNNFSQLFSGEKTPYHIHADNVMTVALMHSLLPNKATGKEPSQTSGELSISGLRRFISSGFTYTYLFLKKSRKNEKVYSITVVLDNTYRIFSLLNREHTITTVITLLESFAHVPDNNGIIIDFILASHNSVNILLHGVSSPLLSSPSLLSGLLTVAQQKNAMHSGNIIIIPFML
jgi:hypothetical protein